MSRLGYPETVCSVCLRNGLPGYPYCSDNKGYPLPVNHPERVIFRQYVNGFMINLTTEEVLLIEKQRPEFQRGKWNGIGGKIEAGEQPIEAMVREFYEETGAITTGHDWQHTLSLEGYDFVVHFYRACVTEFPAYRTTTDETVDRWCLEAVTRRTAMQRQWDSAAPYSLPTLDNMKWILPLQFYCEAVFPITVQWVGKRGGGKDEAHER